MGVDEDTLFIIIVTVVSYIIGVGVGIFLSICGSIRISL